jgi:hypothetical protein
MLRKLAFSTLALALGARAADAPPPAQEAPAQPWATYLQQYLEDEFAAHPDFAVTQGRHEYDGKLPDWSAAALAHEVERLEAARRRAQAYDEASLVPRQRFERQYVLARIDGDLFWLRDLRGPFRNPGYYLGALDPTVYLTRPYAPLPQRLHAFIAYLQAVPAAAAQVRQNLPSPMPRTFANLGEDSFGGYPVFFRDDVPKIFAAVQDAALQRELRAALGPAAQAMQALADWFHAEKARANEDFALGPEQFAAMLHMTERVDTPLAELEAIGRADLQRNLEALRAACARVLPGGSVAACVDKVNADKARGGAVVGARAQLQELKRFVQSKDLVTIPGTEEALVAEAPPYQRSNFAYIDIAGPFDKGMPSIYNIAPPDPKWPKAEQLAYTPGKAGLLFTSVHEVWPGHFLQFLHANRSPFVFGQVFVGYAFAEGWAHYTEEMMWEAGLGSGDPATHVGQLTEALLRNVRFVCAIGLHTQHMSVAQCETLFREQGYVDPGNARQQAARGTYDPAYLNYTLGKLMIRKLREDWTATRGGRAAWKAFHDAFLSYGGPPIPLVREQMLGQGAGALFAPIP